MSTVSEKTYTPDDLLTMPYGDRFELVDGQLLEHSMAYDSCLVSGEVFRLLGDFASTNDVGSVAPSDTGFQCFPDDPDRVRRPDVSFIRNGRLPRDQVTRGHIRIPPDLAVEAISPNDGAYDVDRKVQEYLDAGVQLVWVISPATRTVMVHRSDGTVTKLKEKDDLTGENVIPGFRCKVADIFRVLDRLKTAP